LPTSRFLVALIVFRERTSSSLRACNWSTLSVLSCRVLRMEPNLLLSFVSVTTIWAVTVVTPGPNFLATVHASMSRSRRAGLLVAAGITLGTSVWAIGTLLGLGLLFQTSGAVYQVVRLAGAAYLIFVGVRMVIRRSAGGAQTHGSTLQAATGSFRTGLLTDLSNPKAAAFFTSLFSVVVPHNAPVWFDAALVVAVVAISGVWYTAVVYAVAAEPIAAVYARWERAITRTAGLLFVGLGVRFAAADR
jgi:threonine efflux protein